MPQPVTASERDLERLFLDNRDFEQLASAIEVFCPFDAVGMDRQEIRHGFFLRYILDPQRPHGFGADCLRAFMWAAASAMRDDETTAIRALDVHLMDLDSAIVDREYKSIDLLIQVPAERVVLAVELKIDASEHSGQLGRYRAAVEKDFPADEGWRQIFLFLTKRGDAPSETDGAGWQTLPLETVADMLEGVSEKGGGHPDARMMLNAYVSMLRRRHLTDQRMEDLARNLWREHREALEFLMTRRPNAASNVLVMLLENQIQVAEALSEAAGIEIVPDHSTRAYVRFAMKPWDSVPGMLTGTGWRPSERMLLFELTWDAKSIRCQFELGPGDPDLRRAIFDALKAAGADVGGKWELAPKWRHLATKALVPFQQDDDVDALYEETVKAARSFVAHHVPRYHAALAPMLGTK